MPPQNTHDRNDACISEFARIAAEQAAQTKHLLEIDERLTTATLRLDAIERAQGAQNGALRSLVTRVEEVRGDLGERLGEIHGLLKVQVDHAERWEAATEAYRTAREEQEKQTRQAASGEQPSSADARKWWVIAMREYKAMIGFLLGLLITAALFSGRLVHWVDRAVDAKLPAATGTPTPTPGR